MKEAAMNRIISSVDAGRKNIITGIGLFMFLGIIIGVPLTVDFLGGSLLRPDQYQTWKVIHGYGVFLGFINYFYGLSIDRLSLTNKQKEVSSWSILAAGITGGVIRMVLVFTSALDDFGIYASLGESVFITLGTMIFIYGQVKGQDIQSQKRTRGAVFPGSNAPVSGGS
jgi:hypothetical protein